MALSLTIAGTDRTARLKVNTCRISRQLNRGNTLSLGVEDMDTGYRPDWGQSIVVSEGATKRFGGIITRIIERHHPPSNALYYQIEASDYSYISDRRVVTAEYQNLTLHQIISSINTHFLSNEGITINNVANPGPTITEKLSYHLDRVTDVFNEISNVTGFLWYIDADKDLHFSQFASNPAPFSLTNTSENWDSESFTITRDGKDYRNKQYVRTEYQVEGVFTETVIPTAGQDLLPTNYVTNVVTSITVNGTAKTIYGVPVGGAIPGSGYDFYYFISGTGIVRLDHAEFSGGETVVITYESIFTNVAMVQNTTQQTARAAIEGGSGIYEAVRDEKNIDNFQALEAIGDGLLRQYASPLVEIAFTTDVAGLEPAHRLSINITKHSINATYLVERVDYEWISGGNQSSDFFRHYVTCSNNEPYGKPATFFERLVEMARIGPDPQNTNELSSPPPLFEGGSSLLSWIQLVPPVDADYSWLNQTSGSVTADRTVRAAPTRIFLRAPAVSGNHIRGREKAYTAPRTITVWLFPSLSVSGSTYNPNCGIYFRDSATGLLSLFAFIVSSGGNGEALLQWVRNNSPTSFNATPLSRAADACLLTAGIGLRLVDDNTNHKAYYSTDGEDWILFYSEARTAWLANPNRVGFYAEAQDASNDAGNLLVSWYET